MRLALSRRVFRTLAACLAGLLFACGAWAQHDRGPAGRHEGPRGYYSFRYHDVHRFDRHELGLWRGGRWNNTCFGGRCGWWWFSGGLWYFYTQPIYPYPAVVSGIQYADPAVITAPPMPAPTQIEPAPQFWYYCDDPQGYFPDVQTCNSQFRQVQKPPPH